MDNNMRKAEPASPAKSTNPPIKESFFMLPDNPTERTEVMVMFRIISRRDWDRLQGWHHSCPDSTVEHLMHGLYVLTVPTGSAEVAA